MENYKVKLTILNENDKVIGSAVIDSTLIVDLETLHNQSALDNSLTILLNEIDGDDKIKTKM